MKKLATFLLTFALVSCSTFDVPPVDTPAKRVIAASAQVETLANLTLQLFRAEIIDAEQAADIAEALQAAQNALVIYHQLSDQSEKDELLTKVEDVIQRAEELVANYLRSQDARYSA